MSRRLAILGGVTVLSLGAALLTEASLAYGRFGATVDDTLLRSSPAKVSTPTPMVSITPSPSPLPTATPAPPTPAATTVQPTAVTNGFVHMRASNGLNASILTDLNAGTVVTLLPGGDSQWQKVAVNGLIGFVFKTYLRY